GERAAAPARRRYSRSTEIATPHGPALAEVDEPAEPRFLLVLTHGAMGGIDSPDLLAVRDAVLGSGGAVARVVQPFRLRGARAPGSAAKQDEAWVAIVEALRRRHPGLPPVQGGRSNGARVACRTGCAAGAAAVIAPAFPLPPPGRPERARTSCGARDARSSRSPEGGTRSAYRTRRTSPAWWSCPGRATICRRTRPGPGPRRPAGWRSGSRRAEPGRAAA